MPAFLSGLSLLLALQQTPAAPDFESRVQLIHHDAAIVYGPRPYVLVVLVRGVADRKASGALIASISREVWNELSK
jgi:hypothetical protein